MALAATEDLRPVEIRAGDLELRLAESADEVAAAQRLRYQIFYEEMAAQPDRVREILADGASRARRKAAEVLRRAQLHCGLR